MCGIAGYYGKTPPSDRKINSCLSLMGRRGPDATGIFAHSFSDNDHLRLLHSRLSIIDLNTRSSQPFTIGNQTLAFNGEIYNYSELRQFLEKKGTTFKTTSDTEVLAQYLVTFGLKGLVHCEGMWAFAWYDKIGGKLVLSRDRFGEKPLYYWDCGHGVYFGSEIKFIFALAAERPGVNFAHLYRYLVHGFRALYKGDESFFHDVRLLSQATTLELGPGGKKTESRYWLPQISIIEDMGYQEAVDGIRDCMLDSVRLRLRSDVPLSFCMSGGVDSNSLISIAKRIYNFDVHGFTFTSSDPRYDEMDIIMQAVQELGIQHTVVKAKTDNFIQRLKELLKYHDAPIHTVTWYANWLLMEAIADNGYKISLSGIAADEMFSGYLDHHLAYLYDMRSHSDIYRHALSAWEDFVKPGVRNPYLRDPNLFIVNPDFRDHLYQNSAMFADFLHIDWQESYREETFSNSLLRNRMMNELFYENVPVYTHEEDLNAMYYSVENRSPYLDSKLFEFCSQIPTKYLIRGGRAKVLLRDAMRGIVPDCVLDSPRKVGFNAPIYAFLDVKDPEIRQALLEESPIFEHVRRDSIKVLIQESSLTNTQSKFLFAFLNSKLFLEEYI